MDALGPLVGPFVSAMLGAGAALVGGYFALKTEIAVFRVKLDGLHEAIDRLRADVDGDSRRVDELFGAIGRRQGDARGHR